MCVKKKYGEAAPGGRREGGRAGGGVSPAKRGGGKNLSSIWAFASEIPLWESRGVNHSADPLSHTVSGPACLPAAAQEGARSGPGQCWGFWGAAVTLKEVQTGWNGNRTSLHSRGCCEVLRGLQCPQDPPAPRPAVSLGVGLWDGCQVARPQPRFQLGLLVASQTCSGGILSPAPSPAQSLGQPSEQ